MTASDDTSIITRPRPTDVGSAVAELSRIRAARDLLDELEGQLREFLEEEADTVRELTGTSPTFKTADGCSAYITQPTLAPKVTDDEAFRSWLSSERPDWVQTVRRVQVVDHDLLVETLDAVERGDLHEERDGREILGHIRECLRVDTDVLVAEDALDKLHANGKVNGDRLYDANGLQVEGVEVRARSKPTLTVRVPRDVRRREAELLLARLQPAITTPEGGEAA